VADIQFEPYVGAERPYAQLFDFMVRDGDVVKTTDKRAIGLPLPALLRMLIQGEWLGDDGEREGDSLPDIQFIDSGTEGRVQEIVERRGAVLVSKGMLESVSLDRVTTEGSAVFAWISYKLPGQEPGAVQVPLQR
jgi:hypothetical protein